MISEYSENLNSTLTKLRNCLQLPTSAEKFINSADEINNKLLQVINQQVPAYRESDNPAIASSLRQHLSRLTQNIIDILFDEETSSFNFIREFSNDCAAQHFSLETNLHVYRICHKNYCQQLRSSVLKTEMRKQNLHHTILAIDDFMLEYTDVISTIAAQAYIDQSRIITQAAGDKRAELLSFLLNGFDNSDSRINSILKESGYLDEGQLFCVAVAHAVDPTQMLNHERARRMADSIEKLFEKQHGNHLIDIRENKVIMIFSTAKRLSGWAKPRDDFSQQITKQLAIVGNAAYIGISNDVQAISQIPRAFKQAMMVLKLADPVQRVICSTHLSTYEIMIQLSREEISNSIPDWATDFYNADDKSSGSLSATLQAYANTNMNILKAGTVLSVHPNTIYSRLNKIRDITGFDARRFKSLSELLLMCDIRHSQD